MKNGKSLKKIGASTKTGTKAGKETDRTPRSWGSLLKLVLLVGILVLLVLGAQWVMDNLWALGPIGLLVGILVGGILWKEGFKEKLQDKARGAKGWFGKRD